MDPSRQLYDAVSQDRQLTASLYRQALNDPGGAVRRLVALAAERGLSVSPEEVRCFVANLEDPGSRRWLDKARGGL
ncbi:MAG: hypothetical protein OXF25_10960 [Cyanobacteria bacterium MAG CAR3_bin_5]|nr:hypothetical protein [Cyanobacteria bacterium MAG CAR4_bin_6]MCY4174551.1 hypothetical protein [Cyanobacteria bacterium MAG CAR3_bin_5]MCY4235805.1 hypothetical protein [Cyanobacteria bacterium MAG CAR2_bin_4]MCY4332490.1 hypothetical protein [Cyanobacteria bacterium MAG CAR1_bin_15]